MADINREVQYIPANYVGGSEGGDGSCIGSSSGSLIGSSGPGGGGGAGIIHYIDHESSYVPMADCSIDNNSGLFEVPTKEEILKSMSIKELAQEIQKKIKERK